MAKSSGRSWLGSSSSRTPAITVIEPTIWRHQLRRARTAFYVIAIVGGLLAATVASRYLPMVLAVLLGGLIGVGVGAVVYGLIVAWPVIRAIWYWAPEIGLAVGLICGWRWLVGATTLPISLLLVALVLALPAAIPPVRRRLAAWGWCLIVRHRLRTCFAGFIVSNRQGSLPLILAARPTPAGARVWVWLRPGLSLADLEGRIDKLAVACWANEVRVVRPSTTYAALVRVDLARRNPLATTVTSPLPDLVPSYIPAGAPTTGGLPPTALDLPDVPEQVDDTPARPGRARRPRTPGPSLPVDDPDDWS